MGDEKKPGLPDVLAVSGITWKRTLRGRYEAVLPGAHLGVELAGGLFRRPTWRVTDVLGAPAEAEEFAAPDDAMARAAEVLRLRLDALRSAMGPSERERLAGAVLEPDAKGYRFSVLLAHTAELVAAYGDTVLEAQLLARMEAVRAAEPPAQT